MANENDMFLVGLPLAMAIFASILSYGALGSLFATIGSLAAAIATTAGIQLAGGIQIFGSGVDIKDFSLKITFVTTFLTVFYVSNLILGLNIIMAMPIGLGILLFGVLTTMYVFGMFGMVE